MALLLRIISNAGAIALIHAPTIFLLLLWTTDVLDTRIMHHSDRMRNPISNIRKTQFPEVEIKCYYNTQIPMII